MNYFTLKEDEWAIVEQYSEMFELDVFMAEPGNEIIVEKNNSIAMGERPYTIPSSASNADVTHLMALSIETGRDLLKLEYGKNILQYDPEKSVL